MTIIFVVVLGLTAVAVAACSTPTSSAASGGVEKTLYIAPELKNCTGVAPMKCMQVREDLNGPWTLFYNQIEGFTFEPGYTYELRVRETKVANPPADGSSLKWTLVKLVSKVAVAPAPATGLAGTEWTLVSIDGKPVVQGSQVTLGFGDNGRVHGTAGCNRYMGGYTQTGDKLTFGQVATTMMLCSQPGVMEQEYAYTQALAQVDGFTLGGNQLTLTGHGGQTTLVFAKA